MTPMKLINVKSPECINLSIERIRQQSNTKKSEVIRAALKIGLSELEESLMRRGQDKLTRIIIDSEKNNSEVI